MKKLRKYGTIGYFYEKSKETKKVYPAALVNSGLTVIKIDDVVRSSECRNGYSKRGAMK